MRRGPAPAVLDTSCTRTGLHYQLTQGKVPASVSAAQSGQIRLFMERDTLYETWRKLPIFAQQFGVPPSEVREMCERDWLPFLRVVALPDDVRDIDPRAAEVRALDPTDYPTAALASILSPCILLTHNYTDFAPLNMQMWYQGVDAILAMLDINSVKHTFKPSLWCPPLQSLLLAQPPSGRPRRSDLWLGSFSPL